MKYKKIRSLFALMLASTMLLASCSSGSGNSSSATGTSDGAETASAGAQSGEAVTIRIIESLTSPERTAVMREIADKYEAENQNIKIEIISPPLEGADQKIAQMMQAKQPLDLVEVREQTVQQFINNSWIAPMGDYLKEWSEYDTLTEASKEAIVAYGGDSYTIPYGFYQRALFYRKDWFKEAGIEPPTSFQEIYDAGLKLTDPTQNRFGWTFRGASGGYFYADMFIWAYLGMDKIADKQSAYYFEDGTTIFSTPEAKEALTLYKEYFKNISPKDSIAWGFSEMVQGFVGGTTAMIIQDPEVIVTFNADMTEDQWGIVPMPVGPSGQAVFPNSQSGWGLTSYSEHPDEAMAFLLYLSSAENNSYYAKKYSTIPIHSTAPDIDSYFKEGPFAVYMEMAAKPEVYRYAQSPNSYTAYGEYHTTVDQWYQQYLTDVITLDELLKYLDDYWTAAYEAEGAHW